MNLLTVSLKLAITNCLSNIMQTSVIPKGISFNFTEKDNIRFPIIIYSTCGIKYLNWCQIHGISNVILLMLASGQPQAKYIKFMNDVYVVAFHITYFKGCFNEKTSSRWQEAVTSINRKNSKIFFYEAMFPF